MLWLREHHLEKNRKRLFDSVVNGLLDEAIKIDSRLRWRFKVWNFEPVEFQEAIKRGAEMRARVQQEEIAHSQSYQEWGDW